MTADERAELINAFYALRSETPNGPADLITDLANFHGDFFNFDNGADQHSGTYISTCLTNPNAIYSLHGIASKYLNLSRLCRTLTP